VELKPCTVKPGVGLVWRLRFNGRREVDAITGRTTCRWSDEARRKIKSRGRKPSSLGDVLPGLKSRPISEAETLHQQWDCRRRNPGLSQKQSLLIGNGIVGK
jgi:hypothetical protein